MSGLGSEGTDGRRGKEDGVKLKFCKPTHLDAL